MPPCPYCGGTLCYRDSRKRICRLEGGKSIRLIIRRLRCEKCHFIHNELPDCVSPHKHYATEVISGVLDGIVSSEDEDSEDYPCQETMRRWTRWFLDNQNDMNGHLRRAGSAILELGETAFFPPPLCSICFAVPTKTGWRGYFALYTTAADFWLQSAGKRLHLICFVCRWNSVYSWPQRRSCT